jgi:type III restriction enzyme
MTPQDCPDIPATWIQKTPGIIGGDACIRTTRIAVWMLVEARQVGLSDQELLARYDPPLTPSDLAAAWEYYEHHREEIDQAIRENEDA